MLKLHNGFVHILQFANDKLNNEFTSAELYMHCLIIEPMTLTSKEEFRHRSGLVRANTYTPITVNFTLSRECTERHIGLTSTCKAYTFIILISESTAQLAPQERAYLWYPFADSINMYRRSFLCCSQTLWVVFPPELKPNAVED